MSTMRPGGSSEVEAWSNQSREIETRSDLAHLGSGNFFRLVQCLVCRSENHIFQKLGIVGTEGLRINFHGRDGPIAFRDDLYRASSTGRLDGSIGQILLDLCH